MAKKETASAVQDDVRVQWVPLSHLEKWPRNPKRHDIPGIKQSIVKFGFVQPLVLDESTKRLVAGHGRLEALVQMHQDGAVLPKRIRVQDGEWMVPVLRGVSFATEREAEEYLLADNRLTERGGYDDAALASIFVEYNHDDFTPIGWTCDEMAGVMAKHTDVVSPSEQATPEVPKQPVTKLGQIWRLGDHRLACGDSGDEQIVGQLFGEDRHVLLSTDPPYGDAWVQKARDMHRMGYGHSSSFCREKVIVGDALSDKALRQMLEGMFRLAIAHSKGPMPTYVWCGSKWSLFNRTMHDVGVHIHALIDWAKPTFVISRKHYHPQCERVLYGWLKEKGKCPFYGSRNQSDVWEIARENDGIHPTQKPVELFARPLKNNTKVGEISYEPYAGSGSHIIAAQQLDRRCYAVELDPGYCDVIVERWQNFSGKKAELVTS